MILLLLGLFHLVGGALIADSLADFSGTQGYKGWNYLYFDSGIAPKQFTTYDASWIGGTYSWQQVDSYCQIASDAFHPTTGGNSDNCVTPNGLCKPALQWNNGVGLTNLTFQLEVDNETPSSPFYDGVDLSFLVNGALVERFSTPFRISKFYTVENISSILVILDPKTACNGDGTTLRLRVYAPDPTPSETPTAHATPTVSPTALPTSTPSPTSTGICNTIRSNLFGIQEILNGGGVSFTVNHGTSVIHSPDFLCGVQPTCVESETTCTCTYSKGSSQYCSFQRSTVITYSMGPNNFVYDGQNPNCVYHMHRAFSFPSPTPSATVSPSFTPTYTPTPSPSATGLCNDIKNYVNGRLEAVYTNTTLYNVLHGSYITTPYLPNFDMLIGVYKTCTDYGESCVCTYDRGYNVGCDGARSAIVNFTYGPGIQTSYINVSNCAFVFNASYLRPSVTATPSFTPSLTPSLTATATATVSNTATRTHTASVTAPATVSPTVTPSWTATATGSQTGTVSATVTPTGICNDVRNYVFGRRRDAPSAIYTLHHGINLTHYYYPHNYVLIGANPQCIDYGDRCTCVYGGGSTEFCPQGRTGIVNYKYDERQTSVLVSDIDPPCVYRFNTTFYLPYMSHSPTRTLSATATPSFSPTSSPRFVAGPSTVLPLPSNFPTFPSNASESVLVNAATGFLGNLTTGNVSNGNLIDVLNVLASTLSAANSNLSLSFSTPEFEWHMTSASTAKSVEVAGMNAVLPALADGLVYSLVAPATNSVFPVFTLNALGGARNLYSVAGLADPLTFEVRATPSAGQTIECVYWNGTDWAGDGCAFVNGSCACTHFTEFSARFVAIRTMNANLFAGAGDVYSVAGFKKYGAIYGLLIGLFLGIAGLFVCLLRLDKKAEYVYRISVEDVDEVCRVLGYEKPIVAQPSIHLPPPLAQPTWLRFLSAWVSRVMYQHSYFAVIFRYDPRLPRGFRLLALSAVAFHTLFLTVLLYGYTKVDAEMTIGESAVLSLLTATLNIPFLRILVALMNRVGIAEYEARFPAYSYEYNRRRAFETALRNVPTGVIERVVDRIRAGRSGARAIAVSPAGARNKRGSVDNTGLEDTLENVDTDNLLVSTVLRYAPRCVCLRRTQRAGLDVALEISAMPDPHWVNPRCVSLPTKTLGGLAFSLGAFAYIGWVLNYVLLFTASQSMSAMQSISSSMGISQATSILLTQPLTLLLTLGGTWLAGRWCRRSRGEPHHIGYFADPFFTKHSTSLSGSWAYWIFLYGGSVASLGLSQEGKSLGYSSVHVATSWLAGQVDVSMRPRDALLATLYVYLRGIEKPLIGRAVARAAAGARIRGVLAEAQRSTLVAPDVVNEEESIDIASITNRIALDGMNPRSVRNV